MLKATVLAISVHDEKTNPVFGEGVIHLKIDDESGGGFFVISQPCISMDSTDIRVTSEELILLASEGKKMMDAYDLVTNENTEIK